MIDTMIDTGNRELRKLACDYYSGELSYASYRRARTQLLNRVTEVTNAADCTRSTTRQAAKPARAIQSPGSKPASSWCLHAPVRVLIVALVAVILVIWVIWAMTS